MKTDVEDIYELSPMQQGMLFHSLQDPSGVYVEQLCCRIGGDLDVGAFERAWQAVLDRHASLRASFSWKRLAKPHQIVRKKVELPLVQEDWRAFGAQEREEKLAERCADERRRGFELGRAPLMRLWLARTLDHEYQFVWTYHHLLLDGWCLPLVLEEVLRGYEAYTRGERVALRPIRPYREYIVWLGKQDLGKAEAYFRKYLAGFTAPTRLSVDRLGTPREAGHGEVAAQLTEQATSELSAVARANHLTLNTLLQGAWALLLGRYSGESDVVFGTTVSGRPAELAGVESMVGLFINTLPVRVAVSGDEKVTGWLKDLQAQQAEARQYEHSPLVEVQGWSEVPRGQPLFESLVVFENYPVDESLRKRPGSLVFDEVRVVEQTNYPLTVVGLPGERLSLRISHDRSRIDAATAQRMVGHLARLLEEMAARPEARLGELSMLTEMERQLLVEWNASAIEYPKDELVHELFERQALSTPEAVAVVFEGQQLTYRELNERSNQLGHYLQKLGVGPEVLVAICLPRSLEMVVGLLGVLKAGGAYLPLDAAYPKERLAFMVEDAGAKVLLTEERLREVLPSYGPEKICLASRWEEIAKEPTESVRGQARAENLAYVIYTSGSTGRPKGAMLQHGSVANYLRWASAAYEVSEGRGAPVHSSLSFDLTVTSLLTPLMVGRPAVLLREEQGAEALREALQTNHDFSLVKITPAHLEVLAQGLADADVTGRARALVIGGEQLTLESLRFWRRQAKGTRLINEYGPTETVVGCCVYEVAAGDRDTGAVPIGRPLANMQMHVLDGQLGPVPLGVSGELYIGGVQLGRGYLNRPELTADRFIPNPFSAEPGARLYRTGDLGRYLPDGNIEYLGRIDHQVKLRGFRIELGEIESALGGDPEVREAAVVVREDMPGQKRLVAYVTARGEVSPTAQALRSRLEQTLPEYMVPSAFVLLDALPLTPNGKLDRKALPAPERRGDETSRVVPRTPTEEIIAGVYEQVLRVGSVGGRDDFFALGGHSLLATQVVSRVREALGVELPIKQLFDAPSVAELARWVDGAGKRGVLAPPMELVDRAKPLALSYSQQRLWFLDQLEPNSAAYNILIPVRLKGALDREALEKSLNALVARHETLRTRFSMEGDAAEQIIATEAEVALRVVDVRGEAEPERAVEQQALAEAQRPFELGKGPLLRAALVVRAAEEHALLVTMHHIVSDGWSTGVLIRELCELYRACLRNEAPRLPVLPIQYADFAAWQRGWLSGEVLDEQVGYWKKQLADSPTLLELPTDRPRPATQTYRGKRCAVRISRDLTEQLRKLSREEGATLFMTLLSAFQALLGRYGRQRDVLVGTPIAGRTSVETEGLIGCFVNTLVMRTSLGGDPTVRELVRRVKETALGAYGHQDVPFEKVVEVVTTERSLSHSPLFQVMLVLQNAPMEAAELPGLRLEPLDVESGIAKFDLTLELTETAEGLAGGLEYNTDLFDETTVERMVGHLGRLLEEMAARPTARLSQLSMLTEGERHQLLVEWNDTGKDNPRDKCIHELFELQASRTPDAVAVVFEDESLTYRELDERSNRLGHYLRKRGVGPDVLVAICLERSLEMVVGLLGILKAGGAYVPLDPAYPQERLDFMMVDSGAKVLVTQERLKDELPRRDAEDVFLDGGWQEIAKEPAAKLCNRTRADNLAYVIYTSGSTGRPKGAQLPHGNVVNLLSCMVRRLSFVPADRLLAVTSLSFDISYLELYAPLLAGATVEVASRTLAADGALLAERLQKDDVSIMQATPSTWRMLLDAEWRPQPGLRVLCGGEALPPALAGQLVEGGGLWNVYGPTETTIWSSMQHVALGKPVTIGRPIDNTSCFIVNECFEPVPRGVAGELLIGGVGLARGYLGRSELTAEKFIPDPFGHDPGARLYRTGDLTRYLPDGSIEYLGRIDHQVKIRGFRIELGEVESALASHPRVREVVVLAREDVPGQKRLVAYLTARGDALPTAEELRSHLEERLPDYMVPAVLLLLDALPLTPNGKVDRKALPVPSFQGDETRYVAPRTPIEETLVGVWAKVLRLERIGIHDDFFEVGGDSLLSVQVVSRAKKRGLKLSVKQLMKARTIAALAQVVVVDAAGGTGEELERPVITPVSHDQELPLSFNQEGIWLSQVQDPSTSLVFQIEKAYLIEGLLDPGCLERTLDELRRRHESLRTTFPARAEGPVQIVGRFRPEKLELVDLSELPEATRAVEGRRQLAAVAQQVMDFEREPLFRPVLYRMSAEQHVLFIQLHHIIIDETGAGILERELGLIYAAFAKGEASPLPPPSIQLGDFGYWQRKTLSPKLREQQKAFWQAQFEGVPDEMALPTDHPRGASSVATRAGEVLTVNGELTKALRALCVEEGCSMVAVFMTAFDLALHRYSGLDDLIVGMPISYRSRTGTEALVGDFIEQTAVRTRMADDLSLRELLDRVATVIAACYANQDASFRELVGWEDGRRFTQVRLNYLPVGSPGASEAELPIRLQPIQLPNPRPMLYELSLYVRDEAEQITATLAYRSDLFLAATIQRIVDTLSHALRALTSDLDGKIGHVNLGSGS